MVTLEAPRRLEHGSAGVCAGTLRPASRGARVQIYRGKTFSNVSYDDVGQSFADLQAKTNAVERGAHEIALDIRTRLAAHFASAR